ncbi:Na/Pi cotransporter family protein, partial [Pseudomonas syringae pv. actinidiae ICMP 19079]
FASLTGDLLLDALVGAMFALISYSSLAAVLLTATLAGTEVIGLPVAIGLVIGANIGSGLLALIIPVLDPLVAWIDTLGFRPQELVIGFHLIYNTVRCLIMLPTVGPMARLCAG